MCRKSKISEWFTNFLDINNQKIWCLPPIFQFDRTLTYSNHPVCIIIENILCYSYFLTHNVWFKKTGTIPSTVIFNNYSLDKHRHQIWDHSHILVLKTEITNWPWILPKFTTSNRKMALVSFFDGFHLKIIILKILVILRKK